MAKVTVTSEWSRVDNGLGLVAGTKYRIQPEGKMQLALGATAPDDAAAVTYPASGSYAGNAATYAFTFVTGNANRLWARSVGSAPCDLRAVLAASFEPF